MSKPVFADLHVRFFSALVMVGFLCLAIVFEFPGVAILAVILGGVLGFETARMAQAEIGISVVYGFATAVAVAGIGINFFFLFVAGFIGLIVFTIRFIPNRKWLSFGLAFWAIVGLSATILLVGHFDIYVLINLLIVVAATDIAGYIVGSVLRGPKLWPDLSPKKTWSGAIGGFCIGLAAAWVSFTVLGLDWLALMNIPVLSQLAYTELLNAEMFITLTIGALIVLAALAGDLLISAAKRAFNVKDSSKLIPGHGGLWDRFDGFAAGAFILWLVAAIGWV